MIRTFSGNSREFVVPSLVSFYRKYIFITYSILLMFKTSFKTRSHTHGSEEDLFASAEDRLLALRTCTSNLLDGISYRRLTNTSPVTGTLLKCSSPGSLNKLSELP